MNQQIYWSFWYSYFSGLIFLNNKKTSLDWEMCLVLILKHACMIVQYASSSVAKIIMSLFSWLGTYYLKMQRMSVEKSCHTFCVYDIWVLFFIKRILPKVWLKPNTHLTWGVAVWQSVARNQTAKKWCIWWPLFSHSLAVKPKCWHKLQQIIVLGASFLSEPFPLST